MPPLNLTAANNSISVKPGDLISDAFLELNIGAAGEALQPEEMSRGLACLQRRIDLINAQRPLIYAVNFTLFNAPANTSPIPIGPAQTFNVPSVPVRIESASWILSNGTPVDLPVMNMLSDEEYANVSLKSLTSTLPTALYYSRGPLVGNIYLLPIPTGGSQLRLQLWSLLAQALDQATAIAMPPGYWMYLLCCLAMDLAPGYGPEALEIVSSPAFMLKYREASAAIRGNNSGAPPLQSDVPSNTRNRSIPDYNFITGFRGSR